jgi:hypothetical protein
MLALTSPSDAYGICRANGSKWPKIALVSASLRCEVRTVGTSSMPKSFRHSNMSAALRLKSSAVRPLLSDYQSSNSAGLRLAATCILQQFPNPAELAWLVDRLDPDKEAPFVGFQAAVALAQAVRSLPVTDRSILNQSIANALSLAKRNPHDPPRIEVLNTALRELEAKMASAAQRPGN